jgi:hypothetical protein
MICCVIVSRYHAFFAAGDWVDEEFAMGNLGIDFVCTVKAGGIYSRRSSIIGEPPLRCVFQLIVQPAR